MAKEQFREKRFGAEKEILLHKIKLIVQEYQNQDIKLTLRQLYYQLVARDIIPNEVKEYQKLSGILTDARYCGLVDWSAIEDRIRVPEMHGEWDNVLDLIQSAKASYRLPRWKEQEFYLELFTEKDALSSVLQPIADRFHIHFCVNRGYTSASSIYDLSKRVIEQIQNEKKVKILYLGDFDPSGQDMLRDIRDRLTELLEQGDEYYSFEENVEVIPIALTMAQVKQYNPPENPAKLSDPRAKWYIREYGNKSWEVDALRPEVMIKLVENTILELIDIDKYNAVIKQEKKDMGIVEDFAEKLVKKGGKENATAKT